MEKGADPPVAGLVPTGWFPATDPTALPEPLAATTRAPLAYRRALGGFDVKVRATPLLARSLEEPSAFETLASAAPGGAITVMASDRSLDV